MIWVLAHVLVFAANTTATQVPARPVVAGIEGEWAGSLQMGEVQMKIVLHVTGEKAGTLRAKLDSPDQGVYGMDAASVSHEQNELRFEIASVGATFEGKVAADLRTISGMWRQGGSELPLVLHRQSTSATGRRPANAISPLEGTWQGAFEHENMRFRLQLHVTHDEKKNLTGTFDSLDQGANGLPVSKLSEKNSAVHFEIEIVSGSYDGTLIPAKNAISGKWTQNEHTQPLDFKRSDEVLELRRPQNPAKPYPYKEEEVRFTNEKGRAVLAGTLTIPAGAGPFPAALLIAGSGPQDRDEFLAGHRLFLVLADYLTRKGIAVLRYDKRGIGKSTGDFSSATMEDFTADAEAALAYLKTRKEIATDRIGAAGHGEGALIAPILAGRGGVAWIVLLAGPVTNGERTMLAQSEAIARAVGMPEAQVARSLAFDREAYSQVKQEKDPVVLEKKLDAMVVSTGMSEGAPPAAVQAQIHMLSSPWFRHFLEYDPIPALQKVKCPVLALSGDKDLQVSSKENLPLLRKALGDGGNKDATATELPGLNHLFQRAESGTPAEYGAIEETMSPEVLQKIADWIARHTGS